MSNKHKINVWDRICFHLEIPVQKLREYAAENGVSIRAKASRDEAAAILRQAGLLPHSPLECWSCAEGDPHERTAAVERGRELLSGGEDANLNPADIWIDERILIEAAKFNPKWADPDARREWMACARALLAHGLDTGQWPEGFPMVSDRPAERGPNGERYVLLGFQRGGES